MSRLGQAGNGVAGRSFWLLVAEIRRFGADQALTARRAAEDTHKNVQ
jgi:hypothetical protein